MALNISIRGKLRIGYISQFILIAIIIFSLFFLKSRFKDIADNNNNTLVESKALQDITIEVKDYFNQQNNFSSLEKSFQSISTKFSQQEISDNLLIIWEDISTVQQRRIENSEIENSIAELANNSIQMSNNFINAMSQALSDEYERYNVSTLERLVIAGALVNTDLNHTIKYKFSNLKTDLDTQAEFIQFLNTAIENITILVEQGDTPDKEVLGVVRRCIHSIKGGAAFVGLLNIKDLALVMETTLEMIRNDKIKADQGIFLLVQEGLKHLEKMLADFEGSKAYDVEGIKEQILKFRETP